jgi:rod shape determining protein RodA
MRGEPAGGLRFDPIVLALGLLLMGVGLAVLYSADQVGGGQGVIQRQLVWACVGLVVFFAVTLLPLKSWEAIAVPAYLVALALLVGVLLFGSGSHRWIRVGPVGVQPSEVAKIAIILITARYLATRGGPPERMRDLVGPALLVMLPMALVLRQPDLGTSLTYPVLLFAMLYWVGTPPALLFVVAAPILAVVSAATVWTFGAFLVLLVVVVLTSRVSRATAILSGTLSLAAGIATPILWGQLEPYQQGRILTFLDPGRDPLGAGYQIIQSKVAIGSGGFLGQGFLRGTQKNLSFLPEQRTDFVFSVWGEEFGFLGTAIVLGLFLALLLYGLEIGRSARSRGAGLLAVGVTSLLAFHIFVNVGMTMGLVPVTGLPLPFVSYGGSFLVVAFGALGLLSNVSVHRLEY